MYELCELDTLDGGRMNIPQSDHQSQPVHLAGVLLAGGDEVDSGCLHAGMAEDVGQLHDVAVDLIICLREQVPQIVREYF